MSKLTLEIAHHRTRIAALERCVKAATALIERYGAPANLHAEGTEYHALRSEFDAARAEVDK